MFEPFDFDPHASPEASEAFGWFIERVRKADESAIDVSTPERARAVYRALCEVAAEICTDGVLSGSPEGIPVVHLLEPVERDPDDNPTASVDRGFHDWPYSSLPDPGEHFVLAGRLWGLERRVWFPDAGSVGMYVVDLGAATDALGGNGEDE